jgi:hypothetical protein
MRKIILQKVWDFVQAKNKSCLFAPARLVIYFYSLVLVGSLVANKAKGKDCHKHHFEMKCL